MKAILGITRFYESFLKYLRTHDVKHRTAPLQFTGKLEDYLVKEFASHLFHASQGRRFAKVNLGGRGEQKIDIAILAGQRDVEALVEAKYLRNRHRLSDDPRGAMDEITPTLRSLRKQLALKPGEMHGFHQLHLRGRSAKVYGLVFASYTRTASEPDDSESFFHRVREKAAEFGIRHYDLPRPQLWPGYQEERVEILGVQWVATLLVGLWRL
jgi:hypothetical protein